MQMFSAWTVVSEANCCRVFDVRCETLPLLWHRTRWKKGGRGEPESGRAPSAATQTLPGLYASNLQACKELSVKTAHRERWIQINIKKIFSSPSSCPAASRSPRLSSFTSSSLTWSMSTTVELSLTSSSSSFSFLTGRVSGCPPALGDLGRWVFGGPGAPCSLSLRGLVLGLWFDWTLEGLSISAEG